jgi:hypothetical protein
MGSDNTLDIFSDIIYTYRALPQTQSAASFNENFMCQCLTITGKLTSQVQQHITDASSESGLAYPVKVDIYPLLHVRFSTHSAHAEFKRLHPKRFQYNAENYAFWLSQKSLFNKTKTQEYKQKTLALSQEISIMESDELSS